MAFYHRIPAKYLALIPALYFAGIGSFDIISDAIDHKLTTGNFLFNAALFLPLIVRHWRVYFVSGIIASVFALYIFFVLLVWYVKYINGAHFRYLFDTFVIGPIFAFLILLSGVSLIYAGRKLARSKHTMPAGSV